MNKKEFVSALSEVSGQTKKDSEDFLDAFSVTVINFLANDNCVRIPRLGTFSTKIRGEYEARNPKNGETVFVPETRIGRFSFSKAAKEMINN